MTLCVYAIGSPARGRLSITGLAGERLTAVREGPLAAFVGEVPRMPRPDEDHLREYDRVLKALSRRTPALLPARYGTQVRDLEELHVILQTRRASLRRQLAKVRGRAQMTVRVLDLPGGRATAPHRAGAAGTPPDGSPRGPDKVRATGGAAYLRSRARQEARARDIPQFKPLRGAVRRWVTAERVEQRGAIATVYHLVPRASAAAYRRALARRAAQEGVRVVISGPWPPYAFADPLE